MRILISLICIIISIAFLSGCSSSTDPISQPDIESGKTSYIYSGTFDIDIETQTISQKNRQSDTVYDITGFLPDKCPGGCFRYQIVNVVGTVLEIELTIENPLALQVYDVRLVYTDLFGKTVLNPDSYTDFPGVPLTGISPFTAFAKETPDRAFPVGPVGIDTETLLLDFPPGSQASVNYSITAHLPGQTPEPYEISDMSQSGTLTPTGGSATISCKVDDHQDDVLAVHLLAHPLTGGLAAMHPDVQNPGYWKVEISNTEGAPVGNYKQLIIAQSSSPQLINTYNYVDITVTAGIQWKNIRLRTDSAAKDLAVTPEGDLLILYDDGHVWKYYESSHFAHSSADYLFEAHVDTSEYGEPPEGALCNYKLDVSEAGNIIACNQYGAGWGLQSFDSVGNWLGKAAGPGSGYLHRDVFALKPGTPYGNYHASIDARSDPNALYGEFTRTYDSNWRWLQGRNDHAETYGPNSYGAGYDKVNHFYVVAAESASNRTYWLIEDDPDYYGMRMRFDSGGNAQFYYHYNDAYFGTGIQTEDDTCWNEALDLTSDINDNLYVLDKMMDSSGRIKGFTGDASGGASLGHFDVPSQVDSTPLRIEGSDIEGNFGNLVFVLHGDFPVNGCLLSVFLPDEIPW